MGKLIDADDLIKRIAQIHGNLNTKNVGQAIDDTPDATPRQRLLIDEDGKITPLSERKKGKWYLRDTTRYGRLPYVCTVCGREAIYVYDFCPNCGADMRGENL